jgi:RimJ/RimL family protein N-acetyltransferase
MPTPRFPVGVPRILHQTDVSRASRRACTTAPSLARATDAEPPMAQVVTSPVPGGRGPDATGSAFAGAEGAGVALLDAVAVRPPRRAMADPRRLGAEAGRVSPEAPGVSAPGAVADSAPTPASAGEDEPPGWGDRPPRAVVLRDGRRVTIRPIRWADEAALTALYDRLSPQSAYQRFFTRMRRLPPRWAHILAHVDYDRSMAIVAVEPGGVLIAVARYAYDRGPDEAELAIAIDDPWQGQGLGTLLLRELLDHAAGRGLRRFRAYVLAENSPMLRLLGRVARTLERKLEAGVVSLLLAPGPETG